MKKAMRIAIASGKGGTGKTTIATNLAAILSAQGRPTAYLDCDVEEPNGHIFLNPVISQRRQVTIPVPEVDESRCTHCGACSKTCRYSGIVIIKQTVLTYPRMCHGCGGCSLACTEDAIREVPRPIGIVEKGESESGVVFVHGLLDVGEAMAPPVIRAVLEEAPDGHTLILDSPPGTSCPVIESVRTADVVLLVTEPTPFGLNDLKLAVEMVRALGLPFGVAINRVGVGDRNVFNFCERENIPILMELPDDREIAKAYSKGKMVTSALPELRPLFEKLAINLEKIAHGTRPKIVPPVEPAQSLAKPPRLPSESLPTGMTRSAPELVVISGKGGTGKTSVVASFIALARSAVAVDCDVDAADLHLVLNPTVQKRWSFSGGHEAHIDETACAGCGTCAEHCRFDAIRLRQNGTITVYGVNPISCEGCGICADICPQEAAKMIPSVNGEWFVSNTSFGPMVHARLGIAQENSGKLVSLVRKEATAVADLEERDMIIADGSPGIGCPVIASIAGARMALVVTEPTLSGLHDMKRVAQLTRYFKTRTAVCINKSDINPEMADQLEREALALEIPVLCRIPYDPAVTRAQVQGKTVVEIGDSPAAREIRTLWKQVQEELV